MAGRINDEDIQALRERADIATVISDYTGLKRAGGRLKGLCPFHSERTPSFTVDPARGLYHCFGCGEGGDVYGFLQKVEALSFPEAVERLARLTGYTLRYEALSPGQREALGRRTRLAACVAETAEHYHQQLLGEDGAEARDYLKSRGLAREDAEHFRLGWAADSWDSLVRHLSDAGFSNDEIADAGLATRGARGLTDRFRGRVVFPIYDAGGRDVVAFGGRVLPGVELRTAPRDGEPPKYINSPETEVYKKSKVLYALNWARAEIQRRDTALVVEGYMDVIGLHTAGVAHAVATCGTALTVEHLGQLEKFARRVVLALDADDAGYAAAERARALAEEAGLREVGVLPMPAGQDPADLAAGGADAVEEALGSVQTAVEFQITHLMRGADVTTPEGRVDAYRRTFPLLATLNRVLRYEYISRVVAPAVNLRADRIEEEFEARGVYGVEVKPLPQSPAPSVRHGGGDAPPRDPQLFLERQVLQVALQCPELLPAAWSKVSEDEFTATVSRQLFTAVSRASLGDLDAVLDGLPDDEARRRVRALALSELTATTEPAHIASLVNKLRAWALERRIAEVVGHMREHGEQLDADERRALAAEQFELERRRRDLLEGRDA